MQNESAGFLRLTEIVNDRHGPGLIRASRSFWYQRIDEGRAPPPLKLGPRASAWRGRDIRDLINWIDSHGEWPPRWPLPEGGSE